MARQIRAKTVCLDANIFQRLVTTHDVVRFNSVRGHSEGSPPPHYMGSQNTLDILLKWCSSLSGLLLIVEVNGVHESQKADLSRWVMGQEYIPLEFSPEISDGNAIQATCPVSGAVCCRSPGSSTSGKCVGPDTHTVRAKLSRISRNGAAYPLKLWLDASAWFEKGAARTRWLLISHWEFTWDHTSFRRQSKLVFFFPAAGEGEKLCAGTAHVQDKKN